MSEHPSPAEVYRTATAYAALMRALYGHPAYIFVQPPTADFIRPDLARTPKALGWVTDFAEKTYVEYVLPLLPQGATRRCRALANPWAYADAAYPWSLTWDADAAALKDASTGDALAFPQLEPARARELATDALTRGLMVQKLVLENESDPKARMLLGGSPFDFGDDVKAAARNLVGDLGANLQF